QKHMNRKSAAWLSAGIVMVLGIPSMLANGYSAFFTKFITYLGADVSTDFMTFIGDVSNNTLLPLNGFLISLFAAYVWKSRRLLREMSRGNEKFLRSPMALYLHFTLKYIAPVLLAVIFVITILEIFFGIKLGV
ncbi:MAG TPA: hypothetical protein VI583_13360, partial [Cyclobacteriaceae bacterium]|nr:hypothetical protein [Cyclobacteriaceae bacterium]